MHKQKKQGKKKVKEERRGNLEKDNGRTQLITLKKRQEKDQ